jgi:hypothetical protein
LTSNGARPVVVDVYDVTNGLVIAQITGILATTPTLYTTTTINNVPTGKAVIALRAYYSGASATATVYAAQLGA